MIYYRYNGDDLYDRVVDEEGNYKVAQEIHILNRKFNQDQVIIHITKYGDDLINLAQRYYSDFTLWYLIAEKNPKIVNPFAVPENMELIIPLI